MAVVAERLEVQGVVILMVFVQVMDGELTIRLGDEAAPFALVLEMEPIPTTVKMQGEPQLLTQGMFFLCEAWLDKPCTLSRLEASVTFLPVEMFRLVVGMALIHSEAGLAGQTERTLDRAKQCQASGNFLSGDLTRRDSPCTDERVGNSRVSMPFAIAG